MKTKGFTENKTNIETPNDVSFAEKPLKSEKIIGNRVDINVLKSRLREKENIILKKNILILISCLTLIIAAGISVTYL